MTALSISAPAKLNFGIRILGRRDDGFHEIDSLMVKLPELADQLHFAAADRFSFSSSDPNIPDDDRNLVVKAVRAFESASGANCQFQISLDKVVPVGAGLGGGSSDAAATLMALNHLHGDPLETGQLMAMAATLGSDIPFFLTPGAARCIGRGERVESLTSSPALPVLLLKPEFSVATPDAYRRFADATELPGISYAPQDLGEVILENDLERPVFSKHRFLAELKHWLLHRKEVRGALMSGSGATVFAVLRQLSDAPAVAAAARVELDPALWSWHGYTGDCVAVLQGTGAV